MASEVNFPVECLEDIFHHLDGTNLLTCTEVCPDWNSFIGTTRSCMNKINLSCWSYRVDTLYHIEKFLRHSSRKYSCLDLLGTSFKSIEKLFQQDGRAWTHVTTSERFETIYDLRNLLWFFQSSIQTLDIRYAEVKRSLQQAIEPVDLKFRNLKTLRIGSSCASYFEKTFINCQSLESVRIDDYMHKIPTEALNAIRKTLKSNKRLKTLSFSGLSLFNEDFSTGISFNLRQLTIHFGYEEFHRRNLISFLESQKDSLEALEMDEWKDEELAKTILSLPRLKKLTFFVYSTNSIENIAVGFESLSVVDLCVTLVLGFTKFENFLKAFPKVEAFKISQACFTDEVADTIPKIFKSLKRLWVQFFSANNISNETFYMNLEKIESHGLHAGSKQLADKLNVRFIE